MTGVELGEMTVQFTAPNDEAVEEIEELRSVLREQLSGFDEADAVLEEFALEDFDERLSWGDDDE